MGSGPSVLNNPPDLIDSYDTVVRVNNYKLQAGTGRRCDVHYSFYGNSIKKTPQELRADGVKLCMCKCPNDYAIKSPWHVRRRKVFGVDFRWIYIKRRTWWFCDTYVPSVTEFLVPFQALGKRIPSTGFSAMWTILGFEPKELYMTGFDFFTSKIHNVNEKWLAGDPNDPIRHAPERELAWLRQYNYLGVLSFDETLTRLLRGGNSDDADVRIQKQPVSELPS